MHPKPPDARGFLVWDSRMARAVPLSVAAERSKSAQANHSSERVFVLTTARWVRRGFHLSTDRLGVLPVGSRVHIVETRRTSDSAHRVWVILLGQEIPCGWITYKTVKGEITLREVGGSPVAGHVSPLVGPSPSYLLCTSRSDPPPHPFMNSLTPRQGGVGVGTPLQHSRSSSEVYPEYESSETYYLGTPSTPALELGVSLNAGSGSFRHWRRQPSIDDGSTTCSSSPGTTPGATPRSARSESSAAGGPLGTSPRKMWGLARKGFGPARPDTLKSKTEITGQQAMKARAIQQAAAEAAAAAAAAAAEKANRPLLEAKALDATAIKFGKLVASDEAKLAKGAHKTLAVIIGEHLTLKQLKPHELVQQWAKRGEEPISKMEFRQHIRKMLEQTDVREIDALFERLDEDGGGTLDVDEMRHALKTLQQSAAKGAAEAADTEKRVRHNRKRHDAARHAADLMRKMDQAKRDADLVRSGKIPLRDKLSAFLIDPGKRLSKRPSPLFPSPLFPSPLFLSQADCARPPAYTRVEPS